MLPIRSSPAEVGCWVAGVRVVEAALMIREFIRDSRTRSVLADCAIHRINATSVVHIMPRDEGPPAAAPVAVQGRRPAALSDPSSRDRQSSEDPNLGRFHRTLALAKGERQPRLLGLTPTFLRAGARYFVPVPAYVYTTG